MNVKPEHYWIEKLELVPHSEGGYFKGVYQASETVTTAEQNERKRYTSIYFLLNQESPSHFHRLKSDEIWYFHTGDALTIHMIHPDGRYELVALGMDPEKGETLQYVVPKGVIFGSSVDKDGIYALVSCMVAPGFDYQDFELFTQADLLAQYPENHDIIKRLAFETLPE